jgi:methylated-DNA-protein-cysteine methyltransferase-like protein
VGWDLVYKTVKRVPRGRVTTYGEIARAARLRGGAREAGHAMAATPKGKGIPWHRVVGYGGKLLIREPFGSLQRKLLASEKVVVEGTSLDYEKYGWSPNRSRRKPKRKSAGQAAAKKRGRGRPK